MEGNFEKIGLKKCEFCTKLVKLRKKGFKPLNTELENHFGEAKLAAENPSDQSNNFNMKISEL